MKVLGWYSLVLIICVWYVSISDKNTDFDTKAWTTIIITPIIVYLLKTLNLI